MARSTSHIRLLQADVDSGEYESEFRILVDGKLVKYLTIEAGIYEVDDMCFEPSLVSVLPMLPPGDWNEGHISEDITTGHPYFAKTAKSQLPGIKNLWHTLRIDHLEFRMGTKLRTGVYEAASSHSKDTVVVKLARFAWEIPYLEAETSAHQWINDDQIGPKFLGHLSEEGRVIGFIIERVPDCRHVEVEDLSCCQETLSHLHTLGYKHGDTNKHNFLIRDGKAILVDMATVTPCKDAKVLEEELEHLREQLQNTSGKGGMIIQRDQKSVDRA